LERIIALAVSFFKGIRQSASEKAPLAALKSPESIIETPLFQIVLQAVPSSEFGGWMMMSFVLNSELV
jgi:hypothetical protein